MQRPFSSPGLLFKVWLLIHDKDEVKIRFLTQEDALFRKFDLNTGWVLVFTVIHLSACSLITHMHIHTNTTTWQTMPCWNYHDLSSCHCLTCVCVSVVYVHVVCMRVNVCLQAFVCVRRCRLSHSTGLTSCWITHCNGRRQKERAEEEDLFLPFPSPPVYLLWFLSGYFRDLVFEVA